MNPFFDCQSHSHFFETFLGQLNIVSQAVVKTDYPLSVDRLHYGQRGIDFDFMDILPLVKDFRNFL